MDMHTHDAPYTKRIMRALGINPKLETVPTMLFQIATCPDLDQGFVTV